MSESEGERCAERHPFLKTRCVQVPGHAGVVHVTGDGVQFRSAGLRAAVRFAKASGNRSIRRGEGAPIGEAGSKRGRHLRRSKRQR